MIVAVGLLSACAAPSPTPPSPGNREISARPVSGNRLSYPADMMEQGIEGAVNATCMVDIQGVTSNCVVIGIEGSMKFADAALAYVRGARYKPAIHDGVPIVESHHIFKISFVLDPIDGKTRQMLAQISEDWAHCVAQNQGQSTIDACGRAIDLSASDPPLQAGAYELRASGYAAQRQYRLAIADYDTVVANGFAVPRTYQRRGLANIKLRNYLKAKSDFDVVLKALPNDMTSLRNRSRAAVGVGNFASALEDLDRAITLRPDDPSLRTQRAEISITAGNSTNALVDLEEALAMIPTDVPALTVRCRLLQSMGQLTQAAADCARIEDLDPKHKVVASLMVTLD